MKKIFKILIVFTLSALLLFPFNSYAEGLKLTYLGGFVGNSIVADNTLGESVHVIDGLGDYNGKIIYGSVADTAGSVEFRYSIGEYTLMPGDILRLSGKIAVRKPFNNIQLILSSLYFSPFSAINDFTCNYGVGGSDFAMVYCSFDLTYQFTYSTPLEFQYISFLVDTNSPYTCFVPFEISGSINNDNSFALNQQADKIIQGQQNATNAQTNENFGYSAPNAGTTTDGISAGGNLIDSLNAHIDNFNSSLGSNVDNLLNSIQGFKTIVHNIFDVFPTILQYLVIFGLIFLILRKVVGR